MSNNVSVGKFIIYFLLFMAGLAILGIVFAWGFLGIVADYQTRISGLEIGSLTITYHSTQTYRDFAGLAKALGKREADLERDLYPAYISRDPQVRYLVIWFSYENTSSKPTEIGAYQFHLIQATPLTPSPTQKAEGIGAVYKTGAGSGLINTDLWEATSMLYLKPRTRSRFGLIASMPCEAGVVDLNAPIDISNVAQLKCN